MFPLGIVHRNPDVFPNTRTFVFERYVGKKERTNKQLSFYSMQGRINVCGLSVGYQRSGKNIYFQ
jgi:hypothetical protein